LSGNVLIPLNINGFDVEQNTSGLVMYFYNGNVASLYGALHLLVWVWHFFQSGSRALFDEFVVGVMLLRWHPAVVRSVYGKSPENGNVFFSLLCFKQMS
jgi:hypothetical protein